MDSPHRPIPGAWDHFPELDLHRLDLAARILARKSAPCESRDLLVQAGSELTRAADEVTVLAAIAALIRISAAGVTSLDASNEATIREHAARLLEALDDPDDVALVRGWLRHVPWQRVGITTLRRIRRALRRGLAAGPPRVAVSDTDGWGDLLDALARTLAVERDKEVWLDAAESEPDPAGLTRRAESTRALLREGAALVRAAAPTHSTVSTQSGQTVRVTPRIVAVQPGETIGRFTVLERLGSGAMGVVYSAYDPELDRKIALKILHTRSQDSSARGNARLLREAQAMARLSHPNVVVVHDVGMHRQDVFLAMEFIRGKTLQAFSEERARSWQEVVSVYRQAGAGLAAAHAAGLVHRDFKPANAILGEDGRVRVLDFGLCASTTTRIEPNLRAGSGAELPLWVGREFVGTPAYMSPEQFRAEAVGAASDQFSFCVALYEALYGQRPFAGETTQSIALSVGYGEVRAPPAGAHVPAWLLAVVARGLRVEPEARWPAMEELLRALDRSRTRVRPTLVAASLAALLAGAGGYLAAKPAPPVDETCNGSGQEIAAIWGAREREEIDRRFAGLGPYHSMELWPPVAAALDSYAGGWMSAHKEACLAHRRGENSEVLLDQRMVCLAQRKAGLREAIAVLRAADGEVAARGLEIIRGVPPVDDCADLRALASEAPLPEDPEQRAALAEQRARLERVGALDRAGREVAAIELAEEVVASAEARSSRPALAEALLARARLTIHMNSRWAEDEALLTRAYLTAFGAKVDETALEALALRIHRRSREIGQAEQTREDIALAREFAARLQGPPRLSGLVLNSMGSALLAIGDLHQAEVTLREALAVRMAALGPRHVDVGFTLSNLALVVSGAAERETLVLRALEIFETELGPAHPHSAVIRIVASVSLTDPRMAAEVLERGCSVLERFAADRPAQRAMCLAHLGQRHEEAGELAPARSAWREAVALVRRLAPEDAAMTRAELALIRGYAALRLGPAGDEIAALRAAFAPSGASGEWWLAVQQAELHLCLGLNLAAQDEVAEAREHLADAVAGLASVTGASLARDMSLPRLLARARVELASLLLASQDEADGQRALVELDAAEQWFRGAGDAFAWRVAAIEGLRAKARGR
ncbi:serine/threonine-protein kinase [Nannocystis punicea]|uniref:non-specific serine/threonine protein kinase n=1 Tax=Nannocystis punicea TaxID=2995304 RepID=A0ABY7H9S7_9BACT|nr:serine/threonine-protein kinase [Nannocystis poenicansa]WAS96008.1 serine/threonine-protein kinase [Nannocystis poenicansa]